MKYLNYIILFSVIMLTASDCQAAFTLQEHLGQSWKNERVSTEVSKHENERCQERNS